MASKASTEVIDISKLPLMDEEESRQFVIVVDGHRARMEYDRGGDRIFLTNIHVPMQLEDKDVSNILTEMVLNWVAANNMKLVPYCPFVKTYLRRNTAWQRLLVKGVQV